jgi:hypothetical protein
MRTITLSLLAVIFLGGCGKVNQVHDDVVSGKVEVSGRNVSSPARAGFSDLKMRERTLFEPEVEQRYSMPIHDPIQASPTTNYQ